MQSRLWKVRVSDMVDFKANIYKQLGASNHTDKTRDKHDYYATEPRATEKLLLSLLIEMELCCLINFGSVQTERGILQEY